MLNKKVYGLDVINVDLGIGEEKHTLLAVKHKETQVPRSGCTASGYGNKLATCHMLHIDGHWRRVYAICCSNVSTFYIVKKGKRIVVNW